MIHTALYAALLALLYLGLSVRVIGRRRVAKVALGDGNDADLQRRRRVHGNFAEYVPLALILMLLAESQQAAPWLLHLLGLALLLGRLAHAYGVSRAPENFRYRTIGMGLTFFALGVGAVANLLLAAIS